MTWPVELSGVTETVATTRGPNDRWNVAALGVRAGDPVTATTWGRTRTWRNFTERGGGYVQFVTDPVDFVEAACSIREADEPVLDSAAAWVEVDVRPLDDGNEGDTGWVEWALRPVESAVERETVPTWNRATWAVVEATVAASRLDVAGYDADEQRARIRRSASVVDSCAGERERTAWQRFEELVDWRA